MLARLRAGCVHQRLAAALLCALLCLAALPSTAQTSSGKRLAFVIGNSAYASLPRLKNALADADLIGKSLTSIGFDVQMARDTSKTALEQSLISFRNKIGAGDTVVIYYAGHGLQASDENFLIPVDAKLTDALDLPLTAVSAKQVLDLIERTNAGAIIFILDACRDNPFTANGPKSRSIANSDSISRGLARLSSKHTGTLIAFSTSPGDVAQDGAGKNSPYSEALAAALQTPGQSIEAIFKMTRARVVDQTDGRQVPWENSSLVQDILLVPKPGEPPAITPSPCDLAAAHPSDPERVGPSVDYGSLDPQVAIPACEQAVAAEPGNMRYKALLARALDKA
ncbi:MAG: caspase family protein, partial [Bradyrhizobium sp.]